MSNELIVKRESAGIRVILMGYKHSPQLDYLPFLKKPLREASLKSVLSKILKVTEETSSEKEMMLDIDYSIPILVAEDNLMNQVFPRLEWHLTIV
jgi:hypothetical protein